MVGEEVSQGGDKIEVGVGIDAQKYRRVGMVIEFG